MLFGEARFLKLISNRSNPAADLLFTGAMITNELEQRSRSRSHSRSYPRVAGSLAGKMEAVLEEGRFTGRLIN